MSAAFNKFQWDGSHETRVSTVLKRARAALGRKTAEELSAAVRRATVKNRRRRMAKRQAGGASAEERLDGEIQFLIGEDVPQKLVLLLKEKLRGIKWGGSRRHAVLYGRFCD